MAEAYYRMSISELKPLLASRQVSPVEVVEQLLARIAEKDKDIRAYLLVDEEGARAQARRPRPGWPKAKGGP